MKERKKKKKIKFIYTKQDAYDILIKFKTNNNNNNKTYERREDEEEINKL